jgi:hypothetical protein
MELDARMRSLDGNLMVGFPNVKLQSPFLSLSSSIFLFSLPEIRQSCIRTKFVDRPLF